MARRSQCSDAGDNPLDPNYLPPHYREEYRLAVDALVEEDVDGYFKFLQFVDVVDFLSPSEIDYIRNSIQLPKQSSQTDQRYLDTGGDGSSDTYWPLHSDLDAPGLDLGWPQIHHFIGPTEVTTLVNPAAPDMPSIKEQARRLIKNAQMVIAVVMDMFTDVDIFADILNAAMRNVAVYLLLDEANVDHFVNMVNNCRVNLQSLQYLRVRTVTGIRYHCRTGKSFRGQMLDRFILTDCRAVLSGNYSFMWSYEKLHRCMAHLFLGQLVSTFDEEFRILFAQSEPLVIENMEGMTVLPKRPLPGERPMLSDMRKYRTMDTGQQEEWTRQPYEENVDWRMMPLKRQDTYHGPLDIYNRYPSPQSRLDPQTRLEPQFDQGPPRIMDSLAHKRHGFGEGGGGPGRYNPPYQQQGLPEVEQPGRPFYRGQQHLHPRDEPDYGGYGQMDKFWNQDFNQEEPYPEPGYQRDIEPHEGFDPVHNYLSSTRNVDIDQSSDKLIPGPDLPYTTTHPRRHNVGQAYACQTSPTPSNTTEKKLVQEHGSDRKDPTVKRGLRNWRISSYLSAYDSSGEPEGLPMGQAQTIDPFDDTQHPTQQPTPPPPAFELAVPKIPNVREFKVPALPRASQMPAYAKTSQRDLPKRFPDEIAQATQPFLVVPEPKVVTPTPSESSSTTDGEKQEEPEQREPITSTLRRDDSFRRKYNAAAVPRSSRLRSSLIFSSLEQNTNQDNTEQEEDKTKAETEQSKLPFARRSGAREPFEWRSYIKSTDNAKMEEDGSKQGEKDSENKLESIKESQAAAKSDAVKSKEGAKTKEAAKSELATEADKELPKPSQIEQPKIEQPPPPMQQPTTSFLSEPFLDMNDPDQRFLFFKELAAKRKAAKAAEEAAKATEEAKLKLETASKDKAQEKEKEKPQKDVLDTASDKSNKDSKKTGLSGKMDKVESSDQKGPTATQSTEKIEPKIVTKDKDKLKKVEQTEKDVVSATIQKSEVESKKTDAKTLDLSGRIAKIDSGVKNEPTATQSTEKIETKVATDSEKIEAKQSQLSQPASTDKPKQEKLTSQETDASKSAEKQGKPTEAKATAALANVEKVSEEIQPATDDATSNDPQLKTSRSMPDFTKTNMTDLLSSLPSSRIYERSLSQEANKDTTPKSRLWSPSLHRRELLMSFGDKQKNISTVVQIEEEAEESGQTEADGAKSQAEIGDKTKQNQDSKVETAVSERKESTSTKSQFLPTKSKNAQSQQEGTLEKSVSSGSEVKKGGKDFGPSQSASSVDASKKSSALPTLPETRANEESKKPAQSVGSVEQANQGKATTLTSTSDPKQPQASQNKDALPKSGVVEVKDSEKLTPTLDRPKTELKQPINETKKVCPEEMAKSKEKAEEKERTADSLVTTSNSKDSEKSSSTLESDKTEQECPVAISTEDAKQKSTIASTEDLTQLESHSNTSSPASFDTALEFISSEDSDILSPARTGPQNLFKSGNAQSSVSDMSDFETPSSDISRSPMPFMDDAFDDNVSIAETVIEAASRRKSETPEEMKLDGGAKNSMQESQKGLPKESAQIEPLQERPSLEKGTESLDGVKVKSESTEQLATAKEESRSNLATQEDTAKTSEAGKLEEKKVEGNIGCPGSSQVQKETKMAEKATEITTESGIKEQSGPAKKVSGEASKTSISTDVKTQDLTSKSETNAQLSEEKMASPAGLATSGETKDTRMDKTADVATKDEAKSTEPGKESIDVKSMDPKDSTINSEAEIKPLTNEADEKPVAKVPDISSKGSAVSQEPKRETKTRIISSRFLMEPSIPSVKTQATPKVTEEVTKADKITETKEKSQTTDENKKEMGKEATTEKGQNLEASESETKPVATKTNTEISKVETQATLDTTVADQTTEIKTTEAPVASENVVCKNNEKGESKTEVSGGASPATQEAKMADGVSEITTKDTTESIGKDTQVDVSKEKETKTEVSSSTSQASQSTTGSSTSEDTKVLDSESKIVKEVSADDQNEQKSKDTNVNAKDVEHTQKDQVKQNAVSEPAKGSETTPPNVQPKQQSKPSQSRYLSSTANVISSSNLRDDTKILLEQISANSQCRNESTAAKEAPVTDDEKEDEADKNAKRKKENELRSSLSQQKPTQEREKVLERIQTMRKDRKVYSRFEL